MPLDVSEYTDKQLSMYFKELFKLADVNGDGVLSPDEFITLFRLTGFEFSTDQIIQIMDACDINRDGVIEYEEFIPVAVSILQASSEPEPMPTQEKRAEASTPASLDVGNYTEEELETYFERLFQLADTNGDGVLQPEELQNLLSLTGFNISPAEAAQVMHACDINGDGVIEYEEFVPLAVAILKGAKEQALKQEEYTSQQLAEYFQELFRIADTDGNGTLSPAEASKLLSMCGFNLPSHAVAEIVDAADVNHDGVIDYNEFVPLMVGILEAKQDTQQNTQQNTQQVAETAPAVLSEDDGLMGMEYEQLKSLAIHRGLKKDGVPWNVCCPPCGRDVEGQRRGPDSCASQDIVAALRGQKGHVSNYWKHDSLGQYKGARRCPGPGGFLVPGRGC